MITEPDLPQPLPHPRADRLFALFLFGIVALNPPLLRVFGVPELVLGWPLLIAYLFTVWGVLIGAVAWHIERTVDRSGGTHLRE